MLASILPHIVKSRMYHCAPTYCLEVFSIPAHANITHKSSSTHISRPHVSHIVLAVVSHFGRLGWLLVWSGGQVFWLWWWWLCWWGRCLDKGYNEKDGGLWDKINKTNGSVVDKKWFWLSSIGTGQLKCIVWYDLFRSQYQCLDVLFYPLKTSYVNIILDKHSYHGSKQVIRFLDTTSKASSDLFLNRIVLHF